MAISRIQFRGISRTPSDRMTQDGGCAESLNLVLEDSESVPAARPEDITAAAGLPEGKSGWEVVYIHKTQSYTNYVVLNGNSLGVWDCNDGGYIFSPFLNLEEKEAVKDIESVGNTLIVSTSRSMYYVLHNNDGYTLLGNQIPSPPLRFPCSRTDFEKAGYSFNTQIDENIQYVKTNGFSTATAATIPGSAFRSDEDFQASWSGKVMFNQSIKSYLKRMIEARQSYRRPWAPFFIRYAVRLYDGSHTRLSPPILIGAGKRCSWNLYTEYEPYLNRSNYIIELNAPLRVKVELPYYDYKGWSDLVQGIDIYATEPLKMPYVKTDEVDESYTAVKRLINRRVDGTTENSHVFHDMEMEGGSSDEQIEEALLNLSLFYKIASYEVDANSKQKSIDDLITNGDYIGFLSENNEENCIEYPLIETLVAQDRLSDEYLSDHQMMGDRLMAYNNRLHLIGVNTILSRGYPYFNSSMFFNPSSGEIPFCYRIRYYVNSSKRETKDESFRIGGSSLNSADAHYYDGTVYLLPRVDLSYDEGGSPYIVFEEYFGWISYPDPRCSKVDIECYECEYVSKGVVKVGALVGRKSMAMKEHPNLNVSYAFWGMGTPLSSILDGSGSSLADESENRRIDESNKVIQSEVDNPFVFPAGNRFSFSGSVYGIATTTKALSTGQFGQYPLYVFTSDGIWALETAADGTFSSASPLSRETCSSPDTITPIDQSIVFVTEKGVMLLQSSDIIELSRDMNGRHYSAEKQVKDLLAGSRWSQFSDILSDDTAFMEFVSKSRIAYDYTGARLIFFSEEDPAYQYVYMIKTGTWHKQSIIVSGTVPVLKRVLNSYPDCYISAAGSDGRSMLLNLSTPLDVRSRDRMAGVLVSRPFDLDNPDVMKVINRLRIRGNFSKGASKYIVLGSQDGINFKVLKSLRGGSYKLFRIVVLTDMYPDERISWIDIDYSVRFANRLR